MFKNRILGWNGYAKSIFIWGTLRPFPVEGKTPTYYVRMERTLTNNRGTRKSNF